jgi:hypothetical protein
MVYLQEFLEKLHKIKEGNLQKDIGLYLMVMLIHNGHKI